MFAPQRWSVAAICGALALGAAASESELTLNIAGRTTTYAPASLLGMPSATSVSIPLDVAYKRAMMFRAVPLASLLAGLGPDESVRFSDADGHSIILPASLLLGRAAGAVAYLAVEAPESPWPPLRENRPGTAGPFYLVWANPERGAVTPELWPEQIVHIEAIAPLAKRYPMLVPATALSSRDPIRRGFAVYVRQCSMCHTVNSGGDTTIGPDLNVPYSPTEYLRVDALRRLIRDPQSLRRWPSAKMPAYTTAAVSDRELTDLLSYLRHMADRKVAVPVVKQ